MSGFGVSRTARGLASLLLAMLFAGAMSVFWLTVSAPSASAATVTEPVEIVDPTTRSSGDGWSWDPAGSAGTLTLEGADIQVADMKDANAAIVVPDGATIHLKGENTIVSAAPSASSSDLLAAIYCEGDLTITGDDAASASIRGEGSLNAGIYCVGDLSIQSGVELNVSAVNDGYAGTFVNGNLVITGGSTVATIGSSEGLVVMGSTNIADAAQVKLGTENATPGDSLAANFTGDVTISGTEVIVSGSGVEFWGTAALAGSEVTMEVDTSGAIHAMKGLEITDGSNVSASSSGHVIEILGDMLVQGSTLRVEGVGIWDTAITVTDGNLTVDGSSVTALGDSTERTKGISLNVIRKGSLAGNLILKGAPSLTIEGTDVAIQFVSQAEDLQGNHVVIGDPNIGAVEGGMLTYAERDFGTDFLGVWTYSTGDVSIGDNFAVEGASQRVVIGTENSVLLVTDNGAAAAGIEDVKAIAADGTEYAAQEWLDGSHVGYYRFARDLPAGTYTLDFGAGYETAGAAVIEVIDLGQSLFTMNFHTVEVAQADNVWAWMIQPSTGERVSVLEHVLYGAEIQIGAQPDNGYRFVKWEVAGAAPEWENGDAAKAEQMVTVIGQATMTPTVEAAAPADPGSGDSGKDSGKGSGKTGLAASGDSADGVVTIAAIAAGIGAAAAAGAAAKCRSRR